MIEIDRSLEAPAYRQIYKQFRKDIEDGVLQPGSLLPAIRDLATEVGVARNTVEAAYKQLLIEGYVTSKRGTGYTVCDLDFSLLGESAADDVSLEEEATSIAPSAHLGVNPLGDSYGCTYDFSYGNRTPRDLPSGIWRTLANEVLSDQDCQAAASYMDPFGHPDLRVCLAEHLARTRDVRCIPEQIVLQPGTQPALSGILSMFTHGSPRVAMEDPGYDGARSSFENRQCDIVPIPTTRGQDVFCEFLKASGADLAFVTPSNQFPLGFIMPLATRLQMIGWARENDTYIIEDDYCCEYRYGSSPVPSLQSLDPDHVIYLGTMSKVLTPSMRLSYVVLPMALVSRWQEAHRNGFCSISWLPQEVLWRFMAKGYWDRYVHATVNLYRKRHDLLMDAVASQLGDRVKVMGEDAGLHVLIGDRDHRDQRELIELARANDVRVYGTDGYWMNHSHPMKNFVLMGFSSIEDELIGEGVKRLRQAWYD